MNTTLLVRITAVVLMVAITVTGVVCYNLITPVPEVETVTESSTAEITEEVSSETTTAETTEYIGHTVTKVNTTKTTTTAAAKNYYNGPIMPFTTFLSRAMQLLGGKYTLGNKGNYKNTFYNGYGVKIDSSSARYKTWYNFSAKPASTIRTEGIDCSGLVYWTLSSLGCVSQNWKHNNPCPLNSQSWLSWKGTPTITWGSNVAAIPLLKNAVSENTRPYWQMSNGSCIPAGSLVAVPGHVYMFLGKFESREKVLEFLHNLGYGSWIDQYVIDEGNGYEYWKLESAYPEDGRFQGVKISNYPTTSSSGKKYDVTVWQICSAPVIETTTKATETTTSEQTTEATTKTETTTETSTTTTTTTTTENTEQS